MVLTQFDFQVVCGISCIFLQIAFCIYLYSVHRGKTSNDKTVRLAYTAVQPCMDAPVIFFHFFLSDTSSLNLTVLSSGDITQCATRPMYYNTSFSILFIHCRLSAIAFLLISNYIDCCMSLLILVFLVTYQSGTTACIS